MFSLLSAALFVSLGHLLIPARRDEESDHPYLPFERVVFAATAGLTIWIGTSWVLALTGTLTRPALTVRLVLVALIAGLIAFRRRGNDLHLHRSVSSSTVWKVAAFLPLMLWITFILWRGAVIPPVSHDALSYHLPKATLMARAAAYQHFDFLHAAIRSTPVNYELLLAEQIAFSGTDAQTEWLSVVFYVLLAVASGALAERFWRRSGTPAAAAMLAVASAPVVLLHSGAHKNDLMVAFFMVAAGVAAGRWMSSGELRAFVVMAAAFGAGIGTKPQAAALALCVVPFILMPSLRAARRSASIALVLVGTSIAAFLLLGGAVYVSNFLHEGAWLDAKQANETIEIVPYGDWLNLWQGPYVLLAAPFSRSAIALSLPWSPDPWFWRRYELYFSHLGILFSLCVVSMPFTWIRMRGKTGKAAHYERVTLTIAFLAAFALMLPVGFKPHGLYTISLPRYALFIVPVIFGWTVAPLVAVLEKRFRWGGAAALFALAVVFSIYAGKCAENDTFAPLEYVSWARNNPGTRAPAFDANRAASVVDRRAGPRDRIALDAAFGTWIHPAFGADLRRPVDFIPPGDGPPQIGDDVQWVAIDRAYEIVWGYPEFNDLSEARRYLLRGQPAPEDLRVIRHLEGRSDFERVFYNPKMLQAVYRRRAPSARD
ncbi:MAG: hypothetical protein ACXW2P_05250 [Thermoanaerobaculia bacterium]